MNNLNIDAIRTMAQLINNIAAGEKVVLMNRQNTKHGYWFEIEIDARSQTKDDAPANIGTAGHQPTRQRVRSIND